MVTGRGLSAEARIPANAIRDPVRRELLEIENLHAVGRGPAALVESTPEKAAATTIPTFKVQ